MKRTFLGSLLLLVLVFVACDEAEDFAPAPEGTVAVTVASNFSADTDLGTQGVPYDPDTGESGVESARLRVFEGNVVDLNDLDGETELFFDAEGNAVAEEDAAPQILSRSDPEVKLFLAPGDYGFVLSAEPLAAGLLNTTVADGDSITVPLTGLVGEISLGAPDEVLPNEVFDVFLEVNPPGRPDLVVPAADYTATYEVSSGSSDAVLATSALGARLVAECAEVEVTATVVGLVSSGATFEASATVPLSASCEGTTVGADFVPPFVSITSPGEDESFGGAFTLSGEVNDMQSGVDRVEVYDGPVLLGEAEVDDSTTPNTWSFDVSPDQLRDYRLIVLAYDNATNENRAELQVPAPSPTDLAALLTEAVTLDALRAHQRAWQDIADANDGNRFAGFPGYELSAEYVYNLLEEAGYDVKYQEFTYDAFEEVLESELQQIAPNEVTYTNGEDFLIQSFSGSGDVTAPVTAVDLDLGLGNASTSGCEAEDFLDFPEGNIALTQRGACAFATKAEFAQAAGASAVIVFNQGNTEDRTELFAGTLGSETVTAIPTLSASYDLGVALNDLIDDGLELRIFAETLRESLTTRNVIAESVAGDPDTVVMAGAHLDSVIAGPGIQDNGTGSAAILEVALQLAEQFNVNSEDAFLLKNKVRFGWWSAEESGLIGSTFYVNDLVENDPEALEDIALYLNFDMIGSPNFTRGIYDGDQSTFEAPVPVPAGSAQIEDVFEAFYEANDLAYIDSEFSGRSDYQAFINNNIPSGGLFTGAEDIKTEEEVAIFGGTAGIQKDPCYHEACDTFENISLEAFDQNSDAVAYAVAVFAAGDVEELLSEDDSSNLRQRPLKATVQTSTSEHDHHHVHHNERDLE